MSESTPVAARRAAVPPPSAARGLVVVTGTALAMLVADYVVSYLVVMAAFGGPTILIGVPIVAVVLPAVISGLSMTLTGRLRLLGAIAVSILLGAIGAYGILNGILSPLALQQDWPLHIVLCTLCAVALWLLIGPLPFRIVGAAAALGVVILMSLLPTGSEQAAVEKAHAEEQRAAERLSYFRTDGTIPVVTDLDGWRNARLRATGVDAMTWMVSDDGAVADVLVTGNVRESEMDPLAPCTWITRTGDGWPATAGALPEWCVKTDTGWARADGTGISFVQDERLIAVNTSDGLDIREAKGQRSASVEEISALASSLRPMTADEVDRYVLPTYAGVDSPPVNTPGL